MTPVELRDFWAEVIENDNGFEVRLNSGDWTLDYDGPDATSALKHWRIKPRIKVIDMNCILNSNYDVEWSHGSNWVMSGDGKLHDGPNVAHYKSCRVREKHIHFYKEIGVQADHIFLSEDLGLPEGLQIETYTKGRYLAGFEVLGCLDNWKY